MYLFIFIFLLFCAAHVFTFCQASHSCLGSTASHKLDTVNKAKPSLNCALAEGLVRGSVSL